MIPWASASKVDQNIRVANRNVRPVASSGEAVSRP
jgi:hypothetical protein